MKSRLLILVVLFVLSVVLPFSIFSDSVNLSVTIEGGYTPPPPSGGGGGGGSGSGGSSNASVGTASVIFSGRAYPRSSVVILKDAQVAATTLAGADSNFRVTISNISAGSYIFSAYSEDSKGVRSSLLTFPISVAPGVITGVSGIFIAPTIAVDKSEVKKGDNIVIFGQSAPSSEITISVNSDQEFFIKKATDLNGVYLLNFDTSVLEMGSHSTRSKSALKDEISSFSKTIGFLVGTKNVLTEQPQKTAARADLNGDSRVNLVDFSVAAYWYKRSSPPASIDFNSDGKINLVDFSIMAYHWTG